LPLSGYGWLLPQQHGLRVQVRHTCWDKNRASSQFNSIQLYSFNRKLQVLITVLQTEQELEKQYEKAVTAIIWKVCVDKSIQIQLQGKRSLTP
jgi:hypothetical protein